MVRPGAASEYAELRTFALGPTDVVLLRAPDRVAPEYVANLYAALQAANPAWRGTVVTIGLDQDLHVLSDSAARQLYDKLRAHLEKPKGH